KARPSNAAAHRRRQRSSLPGLTRQSIRSQKNFLRRRWMRGSSPRMTHSRHLSHAQARGISHALAQGARPAWAAVRKEMDARSLDCLILCGWPAMWDFNIANARYLCPIGGNAEFNVLVFPRAGEPTSFIYSPVFTDYWRGAQNWVADVRPKRATFGDSVA